jgi:hypothetical protein
MVQILKSTKDFDICVSLNPSTVRVSTENSKASVILGSCAIFQTRNCHCQGYGC